MLLQELLSPLLQELLSPLLEQKSLYHMVKHLVPPQAM